MIELDHICKSFGHNCVINNITLSIKRGEIFGLVGKNGAGKTTLLSIIAGLSNATNGACYINNSLVNTDNRTVKVGYLPDVPEFYDFLSVGEYIDFLYKRRSNYKEKRNELLDLVCLDSKPMIKTLSRGMKQRLGIAAALINNPEIVLLDEPSSALDPMGRYELSEIILRLKAQGKTIILSTHILNDIESICDKVGFLHKGRMAKIIDMKSFYGSKKINIRFRDTLNRTAFNGCLADIEFKGKYEVILSGNLDQLKVQEDILRKLVSVENTIADIRIYGIDLDDVFQEVCT